MENLCPRCRRPEPSLQIQSRVSYSLRFGTPEPRYKMQMGDETGRAGGWLKGEGGVKGKEESLDRCDSH